VEKLEEEDNRFGGGNMVKSSSYNKFTNLMINDVIRKLEGTHKDFLRIEAPDKPSKFIVIGTLGDKSKDYTQKPTDANRTLTTVKNNSLSVKFLLKEKSGNIDIIPSLSVYYRVYPTFEEQLNFIKKNYEEYREKETVDIGRIWKRYDISFKKIKIGLSKDSIDKDLDLTSFINEIIKDKDIYSGGKEIPFASFTVSNSSSVKVTWIFFNLLILIT